jgi:galactose-1-phosphate uridylyltransferase
LIVLKKEVYKTSYLSPRNNFELTEVFAEKRYDPLTGHRVRVYEIDWYTKPVDFYALGEKSKKRCPFCTGRLELYGARFHPDFCNDGHLKKGDVVLIPNILPYAENAAVSILTKEHVVPMGKMGKNTIFDSISLIFDYAKKISEFHKKRYKYAHLHWNYMPTSGGSIIHPHMQVYVTDEPLNYHRRVLEKAQEFKKKYKKEFFEAYIDEEEKEQERLIETTDNCVMISPFASRGMLGEFMIIFKKAFTFLDITEQNIEEISSLIYKLMLFFESKFIPGFNLAFYSSPIGSDDMRAHIRIYPRVYRDTDTFATDVETPTLLYGESFSLISPEKNTRNIKEFLKNSLKTIT